MFLTAKVDDVLITAALLKQGYPYLARDDDELYTFLGDEAIKKALAFQEALNKEIPIKLTAREIFSLGILLKNNKDYCRLFKLDDCAIKLNRALEKDKKL